jgi:hypothetical protein
MNSACSFRARSLLISADASMNSASGKPIVEV